ncbi:Alpha/Beta hydrolase protein [Mycena amicta]|nr:Alpha/Beta hydrolase protein [Mycena amicta]
MADTARLPHLAYLLPSLAAVLFAVRALPLHSNRLPCTTHTGLGSLPPDSRVRTLYPEDWATGGAYVTLPMGRVRYWLVGPETGKKVVLIHGLTTPALVFSRIVPTLVAAGFLVLIYDLYGRGYSDAPQAVPYDANLYVTQLALLLQHVRWERTRVVGYSMGGAIAAAFVATFPDLVERDVALIASAGAGEAPVPFSGYRHFAFVQRLVWGRFSKRLAVPASLLTEAPQISEIVPLQAIHLPGYPRAVTSSLHEGPIVRMRWAFESDNWAGKKVLLVHGSLDLTVPPAHSLVIQSILLQNHAKPTVRLVNVSDAGHDFILTHSAMVGKALVEFFEEDLKV